MRKSNPKLDQVSMEQHDAIHAFIGATTTHEGEVLVSSFDKWMLKGRNMAIQDPILLFREAEKEERDRSPEASLQPLTDVEIIRYVTYFQMLVDETEKQTGQKLIYRSITTLTGSGALVNMPILKTPDGWKGKRQISLLGWLGKMFRVI
jgi:hypothetical protein